MSGNDDLFVAVPLRILEALHRGELTFDQFGILVYLLGAADYRTNEITLTLGALADALGWERSDDKLMRDLRALRDARLIDFSVRQGQRRPLVFRLTGGLRGGIAAETPGRDFRTGPPSGAEVTSDVRKSEEAATTVAERDPQPSNLRAAEVPKPDQTRADVEETTAGIEEKLDHDVGEEARDHLNDERFLELLDKHRKEPEQRGRELREPIESAAAAQAGRHDSTDIDPDEVERLAELARTTIRGQASHSSSLSGSAESAPPGRGGAA